MHAVVVCLRHKHICRSIVQRIRSVHSRSDNLKTSRIVRFNGVRNTTRKIQGLFKDEVIIGLTLVIPDVHADVSKRVVVRSHIAHRHILRRTKTQARQSVSMNRDVRDVVPTRIVVGSGQGDAILLGPCCGDTLNEGVGRVGLDVNAKHSTAVSIHGEVFQDNAACGHLQPIRT